ncbi:PHP domain-containing protein [Paenibacillus tritici]|uniref:CehA/McbA family metallohydrolase n=1 Tax=Paenibacillus tritici TaxID=1873425 RepID=UPI001BADDE9C|nr:CehA/McbA family metallohydrolase [Paenibacillus tritici]QUL55321.1 PHP domain-containing protein [Paenibacillus tritici]
MQIVLELPLNRRITKKEEQTYLELPFAVGTAVERIEVKYTYESRDGAAVIDIGLRSPERIIGWSGGARESFFTALGKATPGYLAGPIAAGEWKVLLGAYRVPDGGCEVHVEVKLFHKHPRWIRGDLHMHSVHSDGAYTIGEAMQSCKDKGLEFMALTDHNNASQNIAALAADDQLVLIPGVELTSYKGHCNLLGHPDALDDFRILTPEQARRELQQATDKGAFISLNHPFCTNCPWELGFDLPFDAVEVWNGPWRPINRAAVNWWQEQLASGQKIIAVGGSDTHRVEPHARHGTPTAYVRSEAESQEEILRGIRAGHVVLSSGTCGTFIGLSIGEAGVGDTVIVDSRQEYELVVQVAGAAGDLVQLWSDRGIEQEWSVESGGEYTLPVLTDRLFYRAEAIRHLTEMNITVTVCLTNPVYLRKPEQ